MMLLQAITSKGHLISLILFLLSYPLVSEKPKTNLPDENNWSGTITYRHTQTSYHSAPYSEFIYHKWHHFYDQLMEAKLSNGKGIAKTTVSLLDTSYNGEKIGSRTVEQWQIDKGNAQGNGNTELSINIDGKSKTYSIEVPIPGSEGTKIRTSICKGCGQPPPAPVTMKMGEDETSIMVEDEKLGVNPDVLTGEKTERKKVDNGEGEEITITRWMFTRAKK
jgi:hypothetical protein